MRTRIAITGAVIGTWPGSPSAKRPAGGGRGASILVEAAKLSARRRPRTDVRPTSRPAGSPSTRRPRPSGRGSVQMGYDRAGWYSYDQLDMRGKSVDAILPGLQDLAIGDVDAGLARGWVRGESRRSRSCAGAVHGHGVRRPAGPGGIEHGLTCRRVLAASGVFLRQTAPRVRREAGRSRSSRSTAGGRGDRALPRSVRLSRHRPSGSSVRSSASACS